MPGASDLRRSYMPKGLCIRVQANVKKSAMLFIMLAMSQQLFFSTNANASDDVVVNCVETPSIKNVVQAPKKFNLSSSLLKRTADASHRRGRIINIVGKVTDVYCRPIRGASVYIWHSDSEGRYVGDVGHDKGFHGSGKATTDNLGNYGFTTILPGGSKGRSPLVHFLVKHSAFADLQTEMFFEDMEDDSENSELSRIPMGIKDLLTARYIGSEGGVWVYEFNITYAEDSM